MPVSIILSEEESFQLKIFNENNLQNKLELADITLNIYNLQEKQAELSKIISHQNDNIINIIKTLATKYSIDVNSSNEKWNFDMSTMTFTKTE